MSGPPHETTVQRFYRFHSIIYDATRWLVLHGRREAVDHLALCPADAVLEVGCGTGLNFALLQRKLDPDRGRVVGVDFSSAMLNRARKRVARHGWSNIELNAADAQCLELGCRFDAILMAYSLSMIPDFSAALERICAHLKPGGRLVILDFGGFAGWGPPAKLMRAWLRFHHVQVSRPYEVKLKSLLGSLTVHHRLRGCYSIMVARQRDEPIISA